MIKLLNHLKHNLVAYVALFVALGGTSYAAINLPAGSVGSKQLRNGAVTNGKLGRGSVGAADLDKKTIGGYVRAFVVIHDGRVFSSRPTATLIAWHAEGLGPGGLIKWSKQFPSSCLALATTGSGSPSPSYVGAEVLGGAAKKPTDEVQVVLSDGQAQSVSVAVVCPQP